VAESDGSPLVDWKRLDVELDSIDPLNRTAAVKRVGLDGLVVSLAVEQAGRIQCAAPARQDGQAGSGEPAPKPSPASPLPGRWVNWPEQRPAALAG
jgi:hypothetical protein